MKRLGIDIDGVLADFNKGYHLLAEKLLGKGLGWSGDYESWPPQWNYEELYGISKDEVSILWAYISQSETFWRNLSILASPEQLGEIFKLANDYDTYFITSRPGPTAKWQTEKWIEERIGLAKPTVLISSKKGHVAEGLDITHFLDDRTENCLDVKTTRKHRTHVYCLDAPYNRDYHIRMKSLKINLVDKVEEFVQDVRTS